VNPGVLDQGTGQTAVTGFRKFTITDAARQPSLAFVFGRAGQIVVLGGRRATWQKPKAAARFSSTMVRL
jgi:hypothetical protein